MKKTNKILMISSIILPLGLGSASSSELPVAPLSIPGEIPLADIPFTLDTLKGALEASQKKNVAKKIFIIKPTTYTITSEPTVQIWTFPKTSYAGASVMDGDLASFLEKFDLRTLYISVTPIQQFPVRPASSPMTVNGKTHPQFPILPAAKNYISITLRSPFNQQGTQVVYGRLTFLGKQR